IGESGDGEAGQCLPGGDHVGVGGVAGLAALGGAAVTDDDALDHAALGGLLGASVDTGLHGGRDGYAVGAMLGGGALVHFGAVPGSGGVGLGADPGEGGALRAHADGDGAGLVRFGG